jgi:plasmid stabilization system protein ParE
MKLTIAPEAMERFDAQISFLMDAESMAAAQRLRVRVFDFLFNHVAHFPRTGRLLRDGELWETWIPRTRLIVWYRIETDRVAVVNFWHTSQDRTQSPP